MPRPPDILVARPRILFVGINPGLTSAAVGHHFAGKGNPFWRLLYAAGLTPHVVRAEDEAQLAELGYALVNLCNRPTRQASELARDELVRGRARLLRTIRTLEPRLVALVGVTIHRIVLPGSAEPGPGPKSEVLAGAPLFVVPNPSGLNASYPSFASKLAWFRALAEHAQQCEPNGRLAGRPGRR